MDYVDYLNAVEDLWLNFKRFHKGYMADMDQMMTSKNSDPILAGRAAKKQRDEIVDAWGHLNSAISRHLRDVKGRNLRASEMADRVAARVTSAVRLDLGRVVTTRGVNEAMREDRDFARLVEKSLRRHTRGDWGNTGRDDWKRNDNAAKNDNGERIMSVYKGGPEGKIWIITEWDRSVTTVLFPSEY